jgi:hypothetical protein
MHRIILINKHLRMFMDYKRIYKSIIQNSWDKNRIKTDREYFESHHIIPEFMFINSKRSRKPGHLPGNPNDKDNLVLLTPREHFLCHVLLYKIYKGSTYEYKVGSALQFFFTKVINKHPRTQNNFIKNSEWYEKCRLMGLQSISKARKGTMPAIDAITRESVGSVSIIDPKVLSGEWVHHSKGRVLSPDERKGKAAKGIRNRSYSGVTDDELYEYARQYYIARGYFNKRDFEILCLKNGYPTMRGGGTEAGHDSFRFNEFGGGVTGLKSKLKNEFGELITSRSNYKLYMELREKFNDKNN